MPAPLPTPIPASAFDGDCGWSFAVALYQRVDVRLRGDSKALRGVVVGILHDPERGVTVDVGLDAPIVHPAIEGTCKAYEQWRLIANLDEVFPAPHATVARDAAVETLIEAATEVRAAHRELPSPDHGQEIRDAGEARIGRAHYALDAALAAVRGGAK